MCKTAIPQFLQIEQNRITANPYTPFSTILACFSTAMLPLLHIEFQENYRASTGREGGEKGRERERATVDLKLARDRPEPSVPIRKKKKNTLGPRVGLPVVFNTFVFASREST